MCEQHWPTLAVLSTGRSKKIFRAAEHGKGKGEKMEKNQEIQPWKEVESSPLEMFNK